MNSETLQRLQKMLHDKRVRITDSAIEESQDGVCEEVFQCSNELFAIRAKMDVAFMGQNISTFGFTPEVITQNSVDGPLLHAWMGGRRKIEVLE